MAHKREVSVPFNINDYVMVRVYGKKRFYLAQVKKDSTLNVCYVDLEKKEVLWSGKSTKGIVTNECSIGDIIIKNYGLRKNINIDKMLENEPELVMRLL